MEIDHVHFYVEDAQRSRDWFVRTLSFQAVASGANQHTHTEVVKSGPIYLILSSPLSPASPVDQFLRSHPAGVADLAFQVPHLEIVVAKALAQGAKLLQPIQQMQQAQGCCKWAKIAAWGDMSHTLIERSGVTPVLPSAELAWNREAVPSHIATPISTRSDTPGIPLIGIDHVVLNVATGDLEPAVTWYQNVLGLQPQQSFAIQTNRSGLRSQVMVHPSGKVQLPINEPGSANSQIQEFLDVNRGPGVQHIALRTTNIVQTIAQLRNLGVSFLEVPSTYYLQLQQRYGRDLPDADWQAIADQQILVDWQDDDAPAMLLQTFTQPIFGQPTFFFEVIERQVRCLNGQSKQAQGFGEGNFRALFEAIEREQLKRGSLR